jgi:hypothetical protein
MKDVEKGWIQGRPLRCSFDIASRGGHRGTHKVNSVTTWPVLIEDRVGEGTSASIAGCIGVLPMMYVESLAQVCQIVDIKLVKTIA